MPPEKTVEEELIEGGVIVKEGEEGGEGGAKDGEGEEADETKPESGEEKDPESGGEGGESGKGGEGNQGEAGEGEGKPDATSELTSLLKEVSERLKTTEKSPLASSKAPAQLSEEQWGQIETDTGMSRKGMAFIAGSILKPVIDNMQKSFNDRLSRFETDYAINEFASKHPDVGTYRKNMAEILKKWSPEQRSNPNVLEVAYLAAKGMGAPEAIKKIQDGKEKNRVIIGKARPGAQSSGSSNGKGTLNITKGERDMWENFGESSGLTLEEYARDLRKNKK